MVWLVQSALQPDQEPTQSTAAHWLQRAMTGFHQSWQLEGKIGPVVLKTGPVVLKKGPVVLKMGPVVFLGKVGGPVVLWSGGFFEPVVWWSGGFLGGEWGGMGGLGG